MRLSEIREIIQLRPVERDPTTQRLAACLNVDDVRLMAKRRLPRAVFDYVDGGADEEITQRENRTAFQARRFSPLALRDVSDAQVTADSFGRRYGAPLGLCPTGYSRMMHPLGEVAVGEPPAPAICPTHWPWPGPRRSKTWPRPGTGICGSKSSFFATGA